MTQPASPASFGRVDADGTVYVRSADGERSVGQIPDVSAEEAMAFYVRRFEALEVEVNLLDERLKRNALAPEEARKSIENVRKSIVGANAVGDLAGLLERLDGFAPLLAKQSEARKAERAKQAEATKQAKEAMVAEAERLAAGNDWRGGVNRFRSLLDEWKALPRIDRATDDDLWHRFSAARTTYTRRRKTQFAEQATVRDSAKQTKEAIIAEARTLAAADDWNAGASGFRDLMTRWKAAGVAARDVDEKLWSTFRGIQDEFFARRQSALAVQDAEFSGNLAAKEELLAQAEKELLPVKDIATARAGYRAFIAKFNELGKVPRESMRPLDNRLRVIEDAIKDAEKAEWHRTDPQARERAAATVAMFTAQISKLQEQLRKAEAKGDKKAVAAAQDSIATYGSWLEQAQQALDDFSR